MWIKMLLGCNEELTRISFAHSLNSENKRCYIFLIVGWTLRGFQESHLIGTWCKCKAAIVSCSCRPSSNFRLFFFISLIFYFLTPKYKWKWTQKTKCHSKFPFMTNKRKAKKIYLIDMILFNCKVTIYDVRRRTLYV